MLNSLIYAGGYPRTLDEKGRLSLPKEWRLDETAINNYLAVANPNGSISIYPPMMVSRLMEAASKVSIGNQKGQQALQKFLKDAKTLTFDKAGRFILGDILTSHAKLEKKVLMIGTMMTINIWNPEDYEKYASSSMDSIDPMSQSLSELGL